MSTSEVFQQFYVKLVKKLPMDDSLFTAELFTCGLLPGDLKQQINAKNTSADKATYFLDHKISPDVSVDNSTSFNKLLDVMEDSGNDSLKELAEEIKTALKEGPVNTDNATGEPPTKKKKESTLIDVAAGVLRNRYIKRPSHVKSDWPKHCVFDYVKLALVEKDDVTLRDDYIDDLKKLRSQGGVDKLLKKKAINGLREIFHHKNEPIPRLILIIGGPGIGKTTLANKICIQWAKDMFLHEDFNIVILIALRTVQQRSLENVMIEQIGQEAYQELIKKSGVKCLIIFEGLDEMATGRLHSDQLWMKIINSFVFAEAVILITSRPHACQELSANRRIAILGFGEEEIKSFVEKSFPNDSQIADTFMQQLMEYPHIHSLCCVPVSLVMIIDIFKFKKQTLPSTLTKIYQHYVVMMLIREMNRMKLVFPTVTATKNFKKICKILPDVPKEMTRSLFLLSKLAYLSFFERDTGDIRKWRKASNHKIIFSEDDLTQCNIKINEQFDGEGLLQVETLHHYSGDHVTYNFIHLTVQEFLCAVYMTTLSQEEQYHLLIVKEHFYDYPNIMTLYCGLTKLDCHQVIYSMICYSTMTAVKCLYEGQWNNDTHKSTSPVELDMECKTLLPYDILCLSYAYCNYPVTQLSLVSCGIRDKDAGILTKWCLNNETTKLQELNLSTNSLTSEGMKHVIKIVTSSPSLRVLDVSINSIGDDGIFLCFQHINSLIKLNVSICGFSPKGAKYVKVMLMENKLQCLNIGYNIIGDDGVRLITEGLQCNNTLTQLDLGGCFISVKGAAYIKKVLMENKKLQHLNIGSNKIGDNGVRHVTEGLQQNDTLTELMIHECEISVKSTTYIKEVLMENKKLKYLNIGRNKIGDDGMRHVMEGLQQNHTLVELMLENCEISAKGAISISEMIKINHTLQVLDISRNPIGDEGIAAIARTLDNASISKLDVHDCNITVTGAESLAATLKLNHTIKSLIVGKFLSSVDDLYTNNITVDGAIAILEAAVANGVCQQVIIDHKYEGNDKVKELMDILVEQMIEKYKPKDVCHVTMPTEDYHINTLDDVKDVSTTRRCNCNIS